MKVIRYHLMVHKFIELFMVLDIVDLWIRLLGMGMVRIRL
jgi:hypothetical protein